MAKYKLLTAGDLVVEEEILNHGAIGGCIYVTNTATGEKKRKIWTTKRNKSNRIEVMTELISEMAPKEEAPAEETTEVEN